MNKETLKYQIALTLIPGVGDVLAKTLVSYCGSAEAIFKQKKLQLLKIPDIGPVLAESITKFNDFKRAEEEIKFIEKYKIQPLFYLDKDYPERLKHCYDSPTMLYYKGNAELNQLKVLAIVGTRKATEYGKAITEEIISGLSHENILIISGLAYGIDICAHKSSLKNNLQTIGVVGHGLDMIYPALHKPIAEKMIGQGGILTEFMSKTKMSPENFPARNRIVAGISDAVLIVEAAEKGGALITAEIANSYNRDVFAIPGRSVDNVSRGCNYLIKSNKAALVESSGDIMKMLGWEQTKVSAPKQRKLLLNLSEDEKILISILEKEKIVGIDTLYVESKFPASKVASLLLSLEFSGVLRSLPGKMYELS